MDFFAKSTDQARYVPDLLYFPYKYLDFNYNVNDNHIDHSAKNEIYIKLIKSTTVLTLFQMKHLLDILIADNLDTDHYYKKNVKNYAYGVIKPRILRT